MLFIPITKRRTTEGGGGGASAADHTDTLQITNITNVKINYIGPRRPAAGAAATAPPAARPANGRFKYS